MTIPIMYRAVALACVAVVVGGSFWIGATTSRAPADVQETAATFTKWERRATALEALLEKQRSDHDDLDSRIRSLESRLDRKVSGLQDLLGDVRASARAAREGADEAGAGADAARASSAAVEQHVESLLRELRVLEDRLEVHLRRQHRSD